MSGKQSTKLVLATNAANKKSATGKASDPGGQCPLVDKHPPVFFDAHMHIQSGACAPLAPLHARMAGIDLSRSTLDEMGTWWAVKKLATGKIGDISPHPTDSIGDMVVGRFKQLADLGHPAQASFIGINIVLMMDMDFCHIDGYEGQPIYFNDDDPKSKRKGERWYKKYKKHWPVDNSDTPWKSWEFKRVYVDWREDWPLDVEEKNREIRKLEVDRTIPEKDRKARIDALLKERERTISDLAIREYESAHPYRPPYDETGYLAAQYAEEYTQARNAYVKQRAAAIEAEMEKKDFADTDDQTLDKFLKDMNTSLFETWNQQLMRTERAAVKNPFRLLPMYHFEPRRYIKEDGSAPFKQLVENGGVYVGFKMYTSQGYMPAENTKAGAKCAAVTKTFFSKCASLDVPIMAHCTPAGFFTHQRELYIDLASPETRDLYKLKTEKELRDVDRLRYFQEHFVHPEAWRPVLQANPSLRLCLAHFASDKPLWNDDPKEFSKRPLTKAETRDLLDAMEKYNDMRMMNQQGRLGARDLLDEYWAVRPVAGAAKPSIDASDVIYGRGWIRTIIELCKEYKNFYTDISYLPTFDKVDSWGLFKKRRYYWHVLAEIIQLYPHMVDKIMFGTDWYMIMLEPYEFDAWVRKTQGALLEVQKLLGGKYLKWDLFHQFAVINPIKFYRIHERHPKIKAALEAKLGKARGIDVKSTKKELTRLYETVKRIDKGKLAQMESEVKQNPLVFTLTEIDK